MSRPKQDELRRWGVFNLVGVLGFCVQLGALFVLKRYVGFKYLTATALAVETAVLHNFVWHERVTWSDVVRPFQQGVFGRLLRFHVANGIISIAGNVAITWALVSSLHAPYLLANVVSVLICAVLNFVAAERFVFRIASRRSWEPWSLNENSCQAANRRALLALQFPDRSRET